MPKSRVARERDSAVTSVAKESGGKKGSGPTFDSRLIPEFGSENTADVVEWFTRAEVLCKHHGVDLALVLPARLTGGAFAVWLQMPEDRRHSAEAVRDALYEAFAMDSLAAYDAYANRRLRSDESVDVYLADLRRLATLYGGVPDRALACAFIAGLPDDIRSAIRAGTRAEALDLPSILARARAVLSDQRISVAAAVTRGETDTVNHRSTAEKARKRQPPQCWTCGGVGHISRKCPNARETASAQAPSPSQ